MSDELKPFDKLLDDWKRAEGFVVWADDHVSVLRNLSEYVAKHSAPAPDHTELVKELVEALQWIYNLDQGKQRLRGQRDWKPYIGDFGIRASQALAKAKEAGF
jgi:hypothetical protein